jgi:hypothetical protein
MDNTDKVLEMINEIYNKAYDIGIEHVKTIAAKELKNHSELGEFNMGMGTYFFIYKNGDIAYNHVCKELDHFMGEMDRNFKLTGQSLELNSNDID